MADDDADSPPPSVSLSLLNEELSSSTLAALTEFLRERVSVDDDSPAVSAAAAAVGSTLASREDSVATTTASSSDQLTAQGEDNGDSILAGNFSEVWGMSQFWYDDETAETIGKEVIRIMEERDRERGFGEGDENLVWHERSTKTGTGGIVLVAAGTSGEGEEEGITTAGERDGRPQAVRIGQPLRGEAGGAEGELAGEGHGGGDAAKGGRDRDEGADESEAGRRGGKRRARCACVSCPTLYRYLVVSGVALVESGAAPWCRYAGAARRLAQEQHVMWRTTGAVARARAASVRP